MNHSSEIFRGEIHTDSRDEIKMVEVELGRDIRTTEHLPSNDSRHQACAKIRLVCEICGLKFRILGARVSA